jgi:hypothetical protein
MAFNLGSSVVLFSGSPHVGESDLAITSVEISSPAGPRGLILASKAAKSIRHGGPELGRVSARSLETKGSINYPSRCKFLGSF